MKRFLIFWAGFCLTIGRAEATTVMPFVFDGLCKTAQTVVHVRCLDNQSVVFDDRDGIFTQTRFAVLNVVKGIAGSELVLVLPGGETQGQKMVVPGMPHFKAGQETVLFLSEPDGHGSPWPVGLGQGCYGVRVAQDGSRQVMVTVQTPLPPGVLSKPTRPAAVGLQDFLGMIRGAIHESEKAGSEH